MVKVSAFCLEKQKEFNPKNIYNLRRSPERSTIFLFSKKSALVSEVFACLQTFPAHEIFWDQSGYGNNILT